MHLRISIVLFALAIAGCTKPEAGTTSGSNAGGSGTKDHSAPKDDAHGRLVELTTDNFQQQVLQADKPVLVDFWAPWCAPCLKLTPIVKKVAETYDGRAVVAKLNIDEAPELAQEYEVTAIPALLVFEGGEVKLRSLGVMSEREVSKMIDDVIAGAPGG